MNKLIYLLFALYFALGVTSLDAQILNLPGTNDERSDEDRRPSLFPREPAVGAGMDRATGPPDYKATADFAADLAWTASMVCQHEMRRDVSTEMCRISVERSLVSIKRRAEGELFTSDDMDHNRTANSFYEFQPIWVFGTIRACANEFFGLREWKAFEFTDDEMNTKLPLWMDGFSHCVEAGMNFLGELARRRGEE